MNPGEEGYEESVARQQKQMSASPEERERIEQRFAESRSWSMGNNKVSHDSFHQTHHRSAKPSRAVFTAA